MKIKFQSTEKLSSDKSEVLQEVERLLKKIARLTTIYHGKIFKLRKKLEELENGGYK